jgi:23S rRNA (guanosine2251-2'-O)-methyltransferase
MREWLYGRQAVREALRAQRRQGFLLRAAEGAQDRAILQEILDLARKRKIPVERVDRDSLDGLGDGHQGVALQADEYPLANLEDIFARAAESGRPALILILDQIQDPQNLGTLLRTAEAAGVDGIVLPAHRAAGVTPAVVNASAGAVEHLLVAQSNLAQAIAALKERDIWVAGLEAAPEARPLFAADLSGPLALVVGSEGEGLRPLVRKSCDFLFSLPMLGRIGSLNAAVAGSIALYAVLRAREAGGRNTSVNQPGH